MIGKVAVIGATGDQGVPLVRRLREAGYRVRAIVRDPARLALAGLEDVEFATADILDEGTLARAFTGQDALALHLPFLHDRERARSMARTVAVAANAAGLRKIVFNTSSYVAEHDLRLEAHDGRRAMEHEFAATGIPFVSIRPMVFMDNLIRRWARPAIVRHGIFAYPAAPDLRISWICLDDVAAYMVAATKRDDLRDARIKVGGPEALTGDEVAARLSRAIGKPVWFRSLSPESFAADMSELVTGSRSVTPGSVYDGMARFYAWYNAQEFSPLAIPADSEAPLPEVQPRSLESWAREQDWTSA